MLTPFDPYPEAIAVEFPSVLLFFFPLVQVFHLATNVRFRCIFPPLRPFTLESPSLPLAPEIPTPFPPPLQSFFSLTPPLLPPHSLAPSGCTPISSPRHNRCPPSLLPLACFPMPCLPRYLLFSKRPSSYVISQSRIFRQFLFSLPSLFSIRPLCFFFVFFVDFRLFALVFAILFDVNSFIPTAPRPCPSFTVFSLSLTLHRILLPFA